MTAGTTAGGAAGRREPEASPSRLPYRVVDAFTDQPFSGNPAAVLLAGDLLEGLPDATLQAIAAEMNLSETAFPHPPGVDGVRRLRWFTPTTEVSLCGHATLAAAHALMEAGASLPLRFRSLSGPLEVHQADDGRLRLDFPADPPRSEPPPEGLLEALGFPSDVSVRYGHGERCAVLELEGGDPGALSRVAPDMRALGSVVLPAGVMGVSVTVALAGGEGVGEGAPRGAGAPGPTFASRFFGPWVGVDEDPVTGMAHCVLAPWWETRLGLAPGTPMEAVQGGRRRGSLTLRVAGDRVELTGSAVTVAEGHLRIRT